MTGVVTFALLVTGAVLALATSLAVSRHSGEEGAGLFFHVLAVFDLSLVATTLGADTALVRHVSAAMATGRADDVRHLLRIALVPVCAASGLFSSALVLSGPGLEQALPGSDLAPAIRLAAPLIPAGAVMTCLFGALRGLGQVEVVTALRSLVLPVLRFTAVVIVLLIGTDLVRLSAAWAWPVAAVLAVTGLLIRVHVRHALHRAGADPAVLVPATPGLARSFWGIAAIRGASALVEAGREWVDVVLVGCFLGPGAAGLHGVVKRCIRMGVLAETTARFATGPMVAAATARGDRALARRIQARATTVLVTFAWPCFLLLAVFSSLVLGLFGPGFVSAAGPMSLICVVMMLAVPVSAAQSVLPMAGSPRRQLISKFAALAVAVVGCLILIPVWGLWGAVTAWGGSVLTDRVLASAQVRLGLRPPLRSALRPGSVALSCFGILGVLMRSCLGPGWAALGATVLLGGITYALFLRRRPEWFGLDSVLPRRP